jgi:ferric-dicitrate binding protein FerR (iron transport regulator)
MDDAFKDWVKKPTQESDAFWQAWIEQNPERRHDIEQARQLILSIYFKNNEPSAKDFYTGWQIINSEIESFEQQKKKRKTIAFDSLKTWQKLAASLVGIILLSTALMFFSRIFSTTQYATQYGQRRTITLPDSSLITINANSKLSFASHWKSNKSREVWLEGEAFFNVRKKPGQGNSKFIVHTEQVDVEVVGTTFNVNNRRGNIQVVLSTGKVVLKNNALTKAEPVLMQPGELAEFSAGKPTILKKKVDPSLYTSWQHKKLIFKNTPLSEIALLLNDTYGIRVNFKNNTLRRENLTGEITIDTADDILQVIEESLDVSITKNNNSVTIQYR